MDDKEVFRLNCELAQRINRETLADPSSPYAGKFVGIVESNVVVVADDLRALHVRLEEVSPNNRRCCWIEASRDYSRVEYVSRGESDAARHLATAERPPRRLPYGRRARQVRQGRWSSAEAKATSSGTRQTPIEVGTRGEGKRVSWWLPGAEPEG